MTGCFKHRLNTKVEQIMALLKDRLVSNIPAKNCFFSKYNKVRFNIKRIRAKRYYSFWIWLLVFNKLIVYFIATTTTATLRATIISTNDGTNINSNIIFKINSKTIAISATRTVTFISLTTTTVVTKTNTTESLTKQY